MNHRQAYASNLSYYMLSHAAPFSISSNNEDICHKHIISVVCVHIRGQCGGPTLWWKKLVISMCNVIDVFEIWCNEEWYLYPAATQQ